MAKSSEGFKIFFGDRVLDYKNSDVLVAISMFEESDETQQNEIREFLYKMRDCGKDVPLSEITSLLRQQEHFAREVLRPIQPCCCPCAESCSKGNCSALEYATLLSMVI